MRPAGPHGFPECEVRTSVRARSAKIEVFYPGRIRVTVPWGFSRKRVTDLLEQKKSWVARVLKKFADHARETASGEQGTVPAVLELRASGETWAIIPEPERTKRFRLYEGEGSRLHLQGPMPEPQAVQRRLRVWLAAKGRRDLVPALRSLARETGLEFTGASVRFQQSRWGSCSARRMISLNAKLLFLPPGLVRYIFIHELCHTRHLNHSRSFWELVLKHDPLCHEHRRQMRSAWKYVPAWLS